jgi:hypothetical protein
MPPPARVRLEHEEDDVLLARARDAFLDAEAFGEGEQVGRALALEVVEVDQRAGGEVLLVVFLVVVVAVAIAALRIVAAAVAVATVAAVAAALLVLVLALLLAALALLAVTAAGIGAGGVRPRRLRRVARCRLRGARRRAFPSRRAGSRRLGHSGCAARAGAAHGLRERRAAAVVRFVFGHGQSCWAPLDGTGRE